jgi:dolichol-phosphate mannosyltransferase
MLRFGVGGIVAFSRVPLRAAFAVGVGLAVLGAVVLGAALASWTIGGRPFGSWAVAGLIVVVSGVQLVFLGILGEYVGAVLDEVRARPHYLVEERVNLDAPEEARSSGR